MTAESVMIPPHHLAGILGWPAQGAQGIVIFAHGSGSSRLSPRNQMVARALEKSRLATLLFDLLTDGEAADRSNVFDISLLGERLKTAITWAQEDERTKNLRIGLFGASTGAAAALLAAAKVGKIIAAIVSRGGRPDLAGASLAQVATPTLLIVGGLDTEVIALNRKAQALLHCENKLIIVPGATHLFEEEGALEQVTELAREWFVSHLLLGKQD